MGELIQQHGQMVRHDDASSFDGLVVMGDKLRRTGFLPAHIKDGVSFAAIVLMGREMGMGTMAACRKLQVIKGTVTERADSQLARFKSAGGHAEFKELSESRAVLVLKHPNGDTHTETFTLDDAKRAGLASNDNYHKHPKAMLRSRAITAGLKSVGWEGASGLYDPDEVETTVEISRTTKTVDPSDDFDQFRPETPLPSAHQVIETVRQRSGLVAKAKGAIEKSADLDELDQHRMKIDTHLQAGRLTESEASELVTLCRKRVEVLMAAEEAAAADEIDVPAEAVQ